MTSVRIGEQSKGITRIVLDTTKAAEIHYDLDNTTDNGQPIVRIRTFPVLINMSKRVAYSRFIADMESGTALDTDDYWVSLRWSDNRGRTWGTPLLASLGNTGEYIVWPTWPGSLGIARAKLFELSWTSPPQTALNGAFVNTTPAGT